MLWGFAWSYRAYMGQRVVGRRGWNISITLSLLWYDTDEECGPLDGVVASPSSTLFQLPALSQYVIILTALRRCGPNAKVYVGIYHHSISNVDWLSVGFRIFALFPFTWNLDLSVRSILSRQYELILCLFLPTSSLIFLHLLLYECSIFVAV